MRIRSLIGCVFAAALAMFVYFGSPGLRSTAQEQSDFPMIEPGGGGEYEFKPVDEISAEDREWIHARISENLERLGRGGRLEPARPDAVPLNWPIRKADGVPWFSVDAISNYVDHNSSFPNQLRDWNCGTRTYDTTSGYNHAGIDVFLWPFPWNSMDNQSAEIVAAAPGVIAFKSDGFADRSCAMSGGMWNAVYVRHSDNSVAWYGHMKLGSLTTKAVGESVAAGEKLGIVGSSGNSTGPHLHFELYNANNQLQDPYQGSCNGLNANSWWASQEPYRVLRLNAITTGSAAPVQPACGNETTNIKTVFQPGDSIFVTAFYRDNLLGPGAQFALVRPDGTNYTTWTQNFTQTYGGSWWWWQWILTTNVPTGNWKVRATYDGNVFETPFVVATPSASISGRVTTPAGLPLRSAVVSLIDPAGARRLATTSSFGTYSFENVPTGATYTMSVFSRRFRFTARTQAVNASLANIDFVGQE